MRFTHNRFVKGQNDSLGAFTAVSVGSLVKNKHADQKAGPTVLLWISTSALTPLPAACHLPAKEATAESSRSLQIAQFCF